MYLVGGEYKGREAWYLGKIISYDDQSEKHTIEWEDGDASSTVNLFECKLCDEWRLVQPDEDIHERLRQFNGESNE